jgi:hypothetical protein
MAERWRNVESRRSHSRHRMLAFAAVTSEQQFPAAISHGDMPSMAHCDNSDLIQ